MKFRPSKYSQGQRARRNWSQRFPESSLTVGSQGGMPIPSSKQGNASLLSDFLARIPFPVSINSGYRSPSVNAAVGGESYSQHMNALAVDIKPPGWMKNYQLATWFWLNQWFFPQVDQVIWYSDGRSHLHIGICPKGATGCSSSRWSGGKRRKDVPWGKQAPQFLQKTRSGYVSWRPSPLDMHMYTLGLGPVGLAVWGTLGVGALYAAWRYQDELRDLAGM